MEGTFNPLGGKLIAAVAVLLIIFVAVRFLSRAVAQRVKDSDTRYRVRKLISFVAYLVGILLIATIFSDRLGGLTVAFGVAGAGVAFALQEVIVSVAGWVAVSFGHFYRTGDRVQLGGIKGDVIDIGILRTTVMEMGDWVRGDQYNGRIVRVANSFVFKEPVFNYSADFPFLWDEIAVPVRFGSDRKLVREIIYQIANEVVGDYTAHAKEAWKHVVNKYVIEDARVDPQVTMSADENWMTYTVRYVVDPKKRRSTKDALFARILEQFDRSEGRAMMAATSAEIHLIEPPSV